MSFTMFIIFFLCLLETTAEISESETTAEITVSETTPLRHWSSLNTDLNYISTAKRHSNCPENERCVRCKIRTAPNPTNPLCTCCGNNNQCLRQHMCVPMQLFCSKGHHLKYSAKENAYICLPCPEGYFCNHRYCRQTCATCGPGYEAVAKAAIQCTPCRKGFYKADNTAEPCDECPFGYDTNYTGAATCSPEDGVGINRPTECLPSGCIPCTNLPEDSTLNDHLCQCCPPNSCSHRDACQNITIPCQNGAWAIEPSKCKFCSKGTFCNTSYCDQCYPCPAGSDKNEATLGSCRPCDAGLECSFKERSQVINCIHDIDLFQGYFKTKESSDQCSPCKRGYFNVLEGSTNCTQCPEGYFCPSPGRRPLHCSSGYYCPPGSHVALTAVVENTDQQPVFMYPPSSSGFSLRRDKIVVIFKIILFISCGFLVQQNCLKISYQ